MTFENIVWLALILSGLVGLVAVAWPSVKDHNEEEDQ